MKQWNKAFEEHGKIFLKPQEDMLKIVKIFKKNGVKKILDLGSGTGRHLVFLAKTGFDVFGLDISEEGAKLSKRWLKEENLKADLRIGSMYKKLPYGDNFFDAIISIQSFHHERIANIRKGIREVERILKPGGLIFMTFNVRRFRNDYPLNKVMKRYGRHVSDYMIIEPRTYMPASGLEKGLPHYMFNKKEIRKEFRNFKIESIWLEANKRHYCFWGIKK